MRRRDLTNSTPKPPRLRHESTLATHLPGFTGGYLRVATLFYR